MYTCPCIHVYFALFFIQSLLPQHQQFLSQCSCRKVNICVGVTELGYYDRCKLASYCSSWYCLHAKLLFCPGTRAMATTSTASVACPTIISANLDSGLNPSRPFRALELPRLWVDVCIYARQPGKLLAAYHVRGLKLGCVYTVAGHIFSVQVQTLLSCLSSRTQYKFEDNPIQHFKVATAEMKPSLRRLLRVSPLQLHGSHAHEAGLLTPARLLYVAPALFPLLYSQQKQSCCWFNSSFSRCNTLPLPEGTLLY